MPCFRPLDAWRTTETLPSGKKAIAFKKSADAVYPIKLPCGQCIGCRLDRSLTWAIRCVHEADQHHHNSYITLTYSPAHLPSDGSLVKWHFQDFMKRLRKRLPPKTVRYFMCGEYGEQFARPHYHACLFGVDFQDKELIRETEGIPLYHSPTLDDIWGYGYCSIGDVTFESAAYVARYITKKITGENSHEHYQTTCEHTGNLINLEPEYVNMSLKPGIGATWLELYQSDLYPSDFIVHKGRKLPIPRYYDKTAHLSESELEAIKLKRRIKGRLRAKDNTPERLAVREKVKILNFKNISRSYENDTSPILGI